jgi:hypothetical protein
MGANGKRTSMPKGTDLRSEVVDCTYGDERAPLLAVPPLAWLQLGADDSATSQLLDGDRTGPAVVAVTSVAVPRPCFHSNLTSQPTVVTYTYAALTRYARTLDQKVAVSAVKAMVGDWSRHGSFLTITASTVVEDDTLGYGGCGLPDNVRCYGKVTMSLVARGPTISATITRIDVSADDGTVLPTSNVAPLKVGQVAVLSFEHPNLLTVVNAWGKTYYCNEHTDPLYWDTQNLCGL